MSNADTKVLIIDDDIKLQNLLKEYLEDSGFITAARYDGMKAVDAIETEKPSLIILDVMMPGKDGFDVLRDIRQVSSLPVIMLTARGEDMDRIIGLEVGADDYMPKPFNPRELLARIRAILRRSADTRQKKEEASLLAAGGLTLDLNRHHLSCGSENVELSATEFRMMELFMKYPEQVFSRDEIMNHARGRDFIAFERSIDVHISRLRAKLETFEECGVSIKTVWGTGYSFRKIS